MQASRVQTIARKSNRSVDTGSADGQRVTSAPIARASSRARPRQGELAFRSWGGVRRGAGRKPKGERALVPHDSRPVHKARFPLLITTRLRPGLPSLRHPREAARVRAALALANARSCAAPPTPAHHASSAKESAPFQVVHHSIQSNHLHLIVEATDRATLTRGMRGLLVRLARALNRLWSRCGPVFADRFHERELRNPRQVRNALVYVLQNLRKHGISLAGPDPLSSGPGFQGWLPARGRAGASGDPRGIMSGGGAGSGCLLAPGREERAALPRPKTWLLAIGWQRHGLIDPCECPRLY